MGWCDSFLIFIRASRDPTGDVLYKGSIFWAENTTKCWPLNQKTIPKHLINNSNTTSEKHRKRFVIPPKLLQMTLTNVKSGSILIENLNFKYQPFELKIQSKVVLVWLKAMPKQSLINSKATSKKHIKRLTFSNPNIVKNDPYKSLK